MSEFIPVCEPFLDGNEGRYVEDALSGGWISSSGPYIKKFEEAFAAYCGVRFGVTTTNGTTALHLALVAMGIGPGDEVIIPSFTMAASAFAVCYVGAKPVFVDSEPQTWNIDVSRIEEKITSKTKAIMPVHIFGTICEMDALWTLANKHGLLLLEDAAEAHGAEYRGKKAGSLSHMAAFSFFANKNIATGEGGMVLTDDEALYKKAQYFKNLCFPLEGPRVYLHEDIGFNYRMTNLHAAIGLAQTEKADHYRALRIRNHQRYQELLSGVPGISFQVVPDHCMSVHWMNTLLVDEKKFGKDRDFVRNHLSKSGVDTRLLFTGMHLQPALQRYGCDCSGDYPVTENLTRQGFYLPSASQLTDDQIGRICQLIIEAGRS